MRFALLAFAALFAGAHSAHAQVFTDRAAFEAAAGALVIETFEDDPLSGTPSGGAVVSISFDDFRVDTDPPAAKVIDVPFAGSENTTPGGKNYLYLDTDRGLVGSRSTFTFDAPITTFGFDYTGMGETGNQFTVEIDGMLFVVHEGSTIVDGFWGYIGSAVTTAVLETTSDSGYGVDQVATGADARCYADCDQSGALDFFDFLCFQNAFAAGDPYADCDGTGALDFFDFLCFQNEFALGCP